MTNITPPQNYSMLIIDSHKGLSETRYNVSSEARDNYLSRFDNNGRWESIKEETTNTSTIKTFKEISCPDTGSARKSCNSRMVKIKITPNWAEYLQAF